MMMSRRSSALQVKVAVPPNPEGRYDCKFTGRKPHNTISRECLPHGSVSLGTCGFEAHVPACVLRSKAPLAIIMHIMCSLSVRSSASLTHHLLRLCLGPSASSRVSAVPFSPIAAASPPVRAVGTNFMLGSGVVYPSGTSWYAEEMYDLQAKE